LASADAALGKKNYARQFAAETVIGQEDLAYTTETDLLEQERSALHKSMPVAAAIRFLRSDRHDLASKSLKYPPTNWG